MQKITALDAKLTQFLDDSYRRNVLRDTSVTGQSFSQLAQDHPEFLAQAKAEHERLSDLIAKRGAGACFASNQHKLALDRALANHEEGLKAASAIVPSDDKGESEDMTSKIKTLAGLAKDTIKQIESEAERVANRLQSAKKGAVNGIAKLDGIAKDVEDGVSGIEDFANQISNNPPLDESEK